MKGTSLVEAKPKKSGTCEKCHEKLDSRMDRTDSIVYRFCPTAGCEMNGIPVGDGGVADGLESDEDEVSLEERERELLESFEEPDESKEKTQELSDETERLNRSPTCDGLFDGKGLGSSDKQLKQIQSQILNSRQKFDVSTRGGRKKMEREKSLFRRIAAPERHFNEMYALNLASAYCKQLGFTVEQFSFLSGRVRLGLTEMPKSTKRNVRSMVSLVVQAFGYPPLEYVLAGRKKVRKVVKQA